MNTWKTKEGKILKVSEMQTSHIQNCIKMLERNMPDFEEDEVLTSDHWSLEGQVAIIPGAQTYKEHIEMFREELSRR